MKLIVGLGNPGKQYERTRHNVGFMAIDQLASSLNISIDKKKFNGLYNEISLKNEKVILLKPQSYINLSGEVIASFASYYKIDIKDILVIVDDMDLEVGKYKLKYKGGSAGHNGLKNIELHLKTQEYKRMKIGISHNNLPDSKDYVLGKITSEQIEKIDPILKMVPNIVNDFVKLPFDHLMSKYN